MISIHHDTKLDREIEQKRINENMTHPLLDAKFDQFDHNPVVDECLESQKAKQVTENNSENTPPTEEWPTLQQGNCTKRGKVCRVNRENMKPLDMEELLQKYEREKELK